MTKKIEYKGKEYLVRTVDISSIPTYEDYPPVDVAGVELNMAMPPENEWGKEETTIDEGIFFYFTEKYLARATDAEIVERLEMYL